MNGRTITVVPVADLRPPVIEQLDQAKVQDLKHEWGSIWRTRLWFPAFGWAGYTFRYPYRGALNSYRAEIRYACWFKSGWFLRKPDNVVVRGPLGDAESDEARTASPSGQYSRSSK